MSVDVKKSPSKDVPPSSGGFNDTFRAYVKDRLLTVGYPSLGIAPIAFNSGIVDDFSDNFNANWTTEQSYGRMDSIANYTNTTRSMSVRLILIAETEKIAVRNLAQMGQLAQFLYPSYEGGQIKDRPLLTVKMVNLIQDNSTGGPLLGYISSLNHNFDLKEGVYESVQSEGDEQGQVFLYPKYLTISFDFTPYHTMRLGYDADGGNQKPFSGFPYGVSEFSAKTEAAQDEIPDNHEGGTEETNAAEAQKLLEQQDT